MSRSLTPILAALIGCVVPSQASPGLSVSTPYAHGRRKRRTARHRTAEQRAIKNRMAKASRKRNR